MKKTTVIKYFLLSGIILFTIFACYFCLNGGTINSYELDFSLLENENPAYKNIEIEKATILTATVKNYSSYHTDELMLKVEDYPDLNIVGWLSESDVSKVSIGDEVTIRGNIKYYNDNYIVIGDAIDIPPYSFKAKLVSINE